MRTLNAAMMVGTLALAAALGTSGIAQAGSGSGRGGGGGGGGDNEQIRIQDDCDPATFNAAVGEGTCVGDGDTTFDEFVEQLLDDGEAGKWRNKPDDTHIDDDEGLSLVNEGGEPHTFTAVEAFGPGCVPDINGLLGLTGPPAADCDAAFADLLLSGSTRTISAASLAPGLHLFQCMIHPWMQTTLEVRHDH